MTRLALAVLAIVILCSSSAKAAKVKTLIEWNFDSPADISNWYANDAVSDLTIKDGGLTGKSVGRDPGLTGPLFEIESSPHQFVEIKMHSTASGTAELFWTNTTKEPNDGFRPNLMKTFSVRPDGTYRVFPFWQRREKIIRLRLDPPENTEFRIDSIRICELDAPALDRTFFDFSKADQQWIYAKDPNRNEDTPMRLQGNELVVSPKLEFQAQDFPWLSVKLRTLSHDAVIQWVTDDLPGIQTHRFAVRSDGSNAHVYNIPTDDLPNWVGTIRMMGLSIEGPRTNFTTVLFAGASNKPMGPAEIEITRFGLRDPVNRAGKPVVLRALVANVGGETSGDVKADLSLLPTVQVVEGPGISTFRLKPGESKLLEWRVLVNRAGNARARLKFVGAEVSSSDTTAYLRFDPPVDIEPTGYVPEPKPVRGEFEVGMYYFPGWHTYARWSVLDDFPERYPVLGYYREGDPEVADWHIKWMTEHGVTFIVYDWYWSAGARQLEHGLHEGYFNARYKDKIKFCLLWANHNPDGTASAEDMEAVTKYWLDNYFLRPEYYKVGGKPVVVIFSPHRLTADMGVEGVRKAFEKSRAMAKERGLPGIFFAACTWPDPGQIKACEREGYDALTGYNYPSAGDKGQVRAPYDDMVTGYQEFWNAIGAASSLPYIPVTEPGWDSRPWHGPNARVRTDKTPEKFGRMLENAKDFVDEHNPPNLPKMVLIEAWNEFGEGDYVEPNREFGFGHVDQIRKVFTSAPAEHTDLVPQDVGLGPYEIEKPKPVTTWEFDTPGHPGWDASQNISDARVEGGRMKMVSAGHDPALYSEITSVDSTKIGGMEIRMKVDKGEQGQLFWHGGRGSFTESASMRFDLIPDGEFHTYRLNLSSSGAWKSRISALRLDPTDTAEASIEIDWIRFVEK